MRLMVVVAIRCRWWAKSATSYTSCTQFALLSGFLAARRVGFGRAVSLCALTAPLRVNRRLCRNQSALFSAVAEGGSTMGA